MGEADDKIEKDLKQTENEENDSKKAEKREQHDIEEYGADPGNS